MEKRKEIMDIKRMKGVKYAILFKKEGIFIKIQVFSFVCIGFLSSFAAYKWGESIA